MPKLTDLVPMPPLVPFAPREPFFPSHRVPWPTQRDLVASLRGDRKTMVFEMPPNMERVLDMIRRAQAEDAAGLTRFV